MALMHSITWWQKSYWSHVELCSHVHSCVFSLRSALSTASSTSSLNTVIFTCMIWSRACVFTWTASALKPYSSRPLTRAHLGSSGSIRRGRYTHLYIQHYVHITRKQDKSIKRMHALTRLKLLLVSSIVHFICPLLMHEHMNLNQELNWVCLLL